MNTLVLLQNGQLASGSDDKSIKVWEVERQTCVATLMGHTSNVTSLLVLPNGQLASGSYDSSIKVWDIERQTCVTTLTEGHRGAVWCLVVLPTGQLASASGNDPIKIWDVEGQCVATLMGHTGLVCSLVVLPNGRLASGSWDRTIKIWDFPSRMGSLSELSALAVHDELRKGTLKCRGKSVYEDKTRRNFFFSPSNKDPILPAEAYNVLCRSPSFFSPVKEISPSQEKDVKPTASKGFCSSLLK